MAGRISSFLVLFMHFRGNACNFGFWVHWERRRSSRNELPIFPFASALSSVPLKRRWKHASNIIVGRLPSEFFNCQLKCVWKSSAFDCGGLKFLLSHFPFFHFYCSNSVRFAIFASPFHRSLYAFEMMCKYYAINTLTHFSACCKTAAE